MKRTLFSGMLLTITLLSLEGGFLQATENPIARLIEANKVELKRLPSDYRPANKNEPLYFGDLLRVQRGGRGVIQCTSNLATWTVPDDGLPRGVVNTCSPPR